MLGIMSMHGQHDTHVAVNCGMAALTLCCLGLGLLAFAGSPASKVWRSTAASGHGAALQSAYPNISSTRMHHCLLMVCGCCWLFTLRAVMVVVGGGDCYLVSCGGL